jgi:hypothetical protein
VVRQVAIARGIDEPSRPQRAAAGLGFHQRRADAPGVVAQRTHQHCMEQQLHASGQQQLIGRALVGWDVVGAHADAALQAVLRRIESTEPLDALEQLVDQAVHQLHRLAVELAVQASEVGDAARGAHAAEEPVALDQQRARAMPRGARRGRKARRAAADHRHVGFGQHRDAARRLVDQGACSGGHAQQLASAWLTRP